MIILDTNVISELMKESADRNVLAWFKHRDKRELYTTVASLAELGVGINLLEEGKRRSTLQQACELIFNEVFSNRVLSFDAAAALNYSRIVPARKRSGQIISTTDAIIASICKEQNASLATRNTSDFENTGVDLINPWLYK